MTEPNKITITIEGPAKSGKTVLANYLARHLAPFFDQGNVADLDSDPLHECRGRMPNPSMLDASTMITIETVRSDEDRTSLRDKLESCGDQVEVLKATLVSVTADRDAYAADRSALHKLLDSRDGESIQQAALRVMSELERLEALEAEIRRAIGIQAGASTLKSLAVFVQTDDLRKQSLDQARAEIARLQAQLDMRPATEPKRDLFAEAFQEFWAGMNEEQRASYMNKRTRAVIGEAVKQDVEFILRKLIQELVTPETMREKVLQAFDKVAGDSIRNVVQSETYRLLREPGGILERLRRDMADSANTALGTVRTKLAERLKDI